MFLGYNFAVMNVMVVFAFISKINWPISQIPECTCSKYISQYI